MEIQPKEQMRSLASQAAPTTQPLAILRFLVPTQALGTRRPVAKRFIGNRGSYNTATGYGTLYNNLFGVNNTVDGFKALLSNANGNYNTAVGWEALYNNTSGNNNTSISATLRSGGEHRWQRQYSHRLCCAD